MTIAEMQAEIEARPEPKGSYAGGMTEGEIEDISEASAALRAKVKARREANGS
jgi:hypothetical protein